MPPMRHLHLHRHCDLDLHLIHHRHCDHDLHRGHRRGHHLHLRRRHRCRRREWCATRRVTRTCTR
ncbi:hypothetical protein LINGRAHAP2_LOCUS25952 [Linum grandiflorum]